MYLYFIRHGQSENNALWAETNSTEGRNHDPELTQLGKEQASFLAAYFKGAKEAIDREGEAYPYQKPIRLTHIYCSLMLRAVATGYILSQALNLPLLGLGDVFETGGVYQRDPDTGLKVGLPGYGKAFFSENYPNLVLPESMNPEGWWSRDFEQIEERPERARRALKNILDLHGGSDDRVALISHGGFYNLFMKALLGMPEQSDHWFTLNNTGITLVHFTEEWVQLAFCNRTDFLPARLIT
jgi:2,3-bisphosphoglycerate-dependent phosphoglycerate mutase